MTNTDTKGNQHGQVPLTPTQAPVATAENHNQEIIMPKDDTTDSKLPSPATTKTFWVTVRVTKFETYHVEATTPEEAMQGFREGNGEFIDDDDLSLDYEPIEADELDEED